MLVRSASAIDCCTASRLAAFPVVLLFLGQAELGEDAVGELFDEIVDFFRAVVEGWHGGHYGGACVVDANHVFEVNAVQRGLAEAEDQRATFFQADVRGSCEQVVRDS